VCVIFKFLNIAVHKLTSVQIV